MILLSEKKFGKEKRKVKKKGTKNKIYKHFPQEKRGTMIEKGKKN
jgi:hypothetical protein